MLNIISHQHIANQNSMSYHFTPSRMGKIKKTKMLGGMWINWNLHKLLMVFWNSAATLENTFFLKKVNIVYHMTQHFYSKVYNQPREIKI